MTLLHKLIAEPLSPTEAGIGLGGRISGADFPGPGCYRLTMPNCRAIVHIGHEAGEALPYTIRGIDNDFVLTRQPTFMSCAHWLLRISSSLLYQSILDVEVIEDGVPRSLRRPVSTNS
jgi:hypothetical protein